MSKSLFARLEAGYYLDESNLEGLTREEYLDCFYAACLSGVVSNIRLFDISDEEAYIGILNAISRGRIEALQWLLWKYSANEEVMREAVVIITNSNYEFKLNGRWFPLIRMLDMDIPIITDILARYRLHLSNISLWLMEAMS